jgi:hypothetical protein
MKFKLYIKFKDRNFQTISQVIDFNNKNGRALFLERMKKQKTVLEFKLI